MASWIEREVHVARHPIPTSSCAWMDGVQKRRRKKRKNWSKKERKNKEKKGEGVQGICNYPDIIALLLARLVLWSENHETYIRRGLRPLFLLHGFCIYKIINILQSNWVFPFSFLQRDLERETTNSCFVFSQISYTFPRFSVFSFPENLYIYWFQI